jgi:hypothetical protein
MTSASFWGWRIYESDMMKAVILILIKFLPLIFGVGFVAPVVGQSLTLMGFDTVWGLPSLYFGLIIGGIWGGIATKTGRWI